jgi:hypothetical protein
MEPRLRSDGKRGYDRHEVKRIMVGVTHFMNTRKVWKGIKGKCYILE